MSASAVDCQVGPGDVSGEQYIQGQQMSYGEDHAIDREKEKIQ